MMADEDISLNEDQILDNLDDTNGEMLNEVSKYNFFISIFALLFHDSKDSRIYIFQLQVDHVRGR